ncbi:hypothetical protein [Desulfosediminicola flagellatus]|uniref:hypothetical protein n=1 Tax=Desulfosediminicola flagellatus TaxID=2569541 RepID=UPI0010AD8832|nr:hypothetical protein [Desulfosediminicola flagellatus]
MREGLAKRLVCCVVLSLVATVAGCAQNSTRQYDDVTIMSEPDSQYGESVGGQSNVGLVPDGERIHLDDKITAEDMIALASRVTEKMLISSEVQSWDGKKSKPLLVVAVPENTTHDANIITEDLQDEIISKVLDSGIARVIDESSLSSSYNYIIKTTITSTRQRGPKGGKITYYTCKLQLFSLRGERLGQWHDKVGMVKAPRSFF